jgi:four helix bundle suffix protein
MNDDEKLIPLHGGYRKLKSFQVSQLVYDVTVRFCERYIERFSRTRDQMVQAARSGVQNIAEGSQASGTSKKTELRLTNVARASLEELRLDYEDFLRQRGMEKWDDNSLLRQELVDRRCQTADEVAMWVKDAAKRSAQNTVSNPSTMSGVYAMISANAALVLINVACGLLSRQISALANEFEQKGGFSERMYRIRSNRRK